MLFYIKKTQFFYIKKTPIFWGIWWVLSNNHHTKKTRKRFRNLYLSELGTKLIDEKREEEKVNVYEIKFQSIYKEINRKEIALSLLFKH
jgi:hypothetical protein